MLSLYDIYIRPSTFFWRGHPILTRGPFPFFQKINESEEICFRRLLRKLPISCRPTRHRQYAPHFKEHRLRRVGRVKLCFERVLSIIVMKTRTRKLSGTPFFDFFSGRVRAKKKCSVLYMRAYRLIPTNV